MKQPILLLIIATCAAVFGGCSLRGTPTGPAVGDACLVGRWTLEHEVNQSGWTYSNVPVEVSGLAGAQLTIAAGGTESESFAGSEPLSGTLADGRVLSITLGGSFTFHLRADGHRYEETGTETVLPVTATLSGVPIPGYHGAYAPGMGTYACSQRSLTTTTGGNVQTDTWVRQ